MRARRLERRLAGIEADLTLSMPRLAGRLDVFAQLAAGEGPSGPERVPAPGKLPRAARGRLARRWSRWARGRHGWRGWLRRPVYLSSK